MVLGPEAGTVLHSMAPARGVIALVARNLYGTGTSTFGHCSARLSRNLSALRISFPITAPILGFLGISPPKGDWEAYKVHHQLQNCTNYPKEYTWLDQVGTSAASRSWKCVPWPILAYIFTSSYYYRYSMLEDPVQNALTSNPGFSVTGINKIIMNQRSQCSSSYFRKLEWWVNASGV